MLHERKAFEELTTLKEDGAGFSDLGKIIFAEIAAFYRRDPAANAADKEVLLAAVEQKLNNDKQFKRLSEVIKELQAVSLPNLFEVYRKQKKFMVANELA